MHMVVIFLFVLVLLGGVGQKLHTLHKQDLPGNNMTNLTSTHRHPKLLHRTFVFNQSLTSYKMKGLLLVSCHLC